jgi:hypothetical protein
VGNYNDDYIKQQEDKKKWLENLKVGNEVACYSGGWSRPTYSLIVVTRVTKTLIVTDAGRFRKDNGVAYEKYGSNSIHPVTKEVKDEILKQRLISTISPKLDKLKSTLYEYELDILLNFNTLIDKTMLRNGETK